MRKSILRVMRRAPRDVCEVEQCLRPTAAGVRYEPSLNGPVIFCPEMDSHPLGRQPFLRSRFYMKLTNVSSILFEQALSFPSPVLAGFLSPTTCTQSQSLIRPALSQDRAVDSSDPRTAIKASHKGPLRQRWLFYRPSPRTELVVQLHSCRTGQVARFGRSRFGQGSWLGRMKWIEDVWLQHASAVGKVGKVNKDLEASPPHFSQIAGRAREAP